MTNEILVTQVGEIPLGEGRTFSIQGGDIAIFRTHDGSVHATQAYCPHLGGPLADGLTTSKAVICPLHDRTYDLVSGCGLTHEHMNIKVFKSRVDPNGNIWIEPDTIPAREPIYVGAEAHIHTPSGAMEAVSSS